MVKMHLYGITITCTEKEVDFFKRAGYVIIEEAAPVAPEPAKPVVTVEPVTPAEDPKPKGKDKK